RRTKYFTYLLWSDLIFQVKAHFANTPKSSSLPVSWPICQQSERERAAPRAGTTVIPIGVLLHSCWGGKHGERMDRRGATGAWVDHGPCRGAAALLAYSRHARPHGGSGALPRFLFDQPPAATGGSLLS